MIKYLSSIIFFLSFLLIVESQMAPAFGDDLTGIWKCLKRGEIAYIRHVDKGVYILVVGEKTKQITIGKVVGEVVHISFCGDIPSSKYQNYTYEGKGYITDGGRKIDWTGGFLNGSNWVKVRDW
jgi:hypothetical protein